MKHVFAEPYVIRVNFIITDRVGNDYNLSMEDEEKLTERTDDLLGTLEQFGDNYVTVCYDSLESAQMFVAEDAKMLDNILNEKEREDERY